MSFIEVKSEDVALLREIEERVKRVSSADFKIAATETVKTRFWLFTGAT